MSDFDAAAAPPWRLRLQIILAWFGLVDDPRAERPADDVVESAGDESSGRKPEWSRILFAVAVPLWASDRVDGWWYAAFVALAAVSGVVELVRWATKWYDGRWIDLVGTLLQLWAMFGLVMFAVFGDDVGAGPALAYAAGFAVVIGSVVWGAILWLARDESPAADSR